MTAAEMARVEQWAELVKRAYQLNRFFNAEIEVVIQPVVHNGNVHGYHVETKDCEKHRTCGVKVYIVPERMSFDWSLSWGGYDSFHECENTQKYFDMMHALANKHNSDENWRVFGHFRFDAMRNAVEFRYSIPLDKVYLDIQELSKLLGVILYKTSCFSKEASKLEGDYLYEHLKNQVGAKNS